MRKRFPCKSGTVPGSGLGVARLRLGSDGRPKPMVHDSQPPISADRGCPGWIVTKEIKGVAYNKVLELSPISMLEDCGDT